MLAWCCCRSGAACVACARQRKRGARSNGASGRRIGTGGAIEAAAALFPPSQAQGCWNHHSLRNPAATPLAGGLPSAPQLPFWAMRCGARAPHRLPQLSTLHARRHVLMPISALTCKAHLHAMRAPWTPAAPALGSVAPCLATVCGHVPQPRFAATWLRSLRFRGIRSGICHPGSLRGPAPGSGLTAYPHDNGRPFSSVHQHRCHATPVIGPWRTSRMQWSLLSAIRHTRIHGVAPAGRTDMHCGGSIFHTRGQFR